MTALTAILGKRYRLTSIKFAEDAVRYDDRVPAHHFVTVAKPIVHDGVFAFCTARDYFDESLCAAVFRFADDHASRLTSVQQSQAIAVIEGFSHSDYHFDSLLVLSPKYHGMYDDIDPWLSARTVEIAPIYRCEFRGDETQEDVFLIRHRGPCTIDWRREPFPAVYMKWQNKVTGSRSLGKGLIYQNVEQLLSQLHALRHDRTGFVESANFRRDRFRASAIDGGVHIEAIELGSSLSIPTADIHDWVENCVKRGEWGQARA